jgi:hypothetical protein
MRIVDPSKLVPKSDAEATAKVGHDFKFKKKMCNINPTNAFQMRIRNE